MYFSKTAILATFLALGNIVAAASTEACLLSVVGQTDNPTDFKAICVTNVDKLQKQISDTCGDDKKDALKQFADTCADNGHKVATGSSTSSGSSSTGTSTKSSSTNTGFTTTTATNSSSSSGSGSTSSGSSTSGSDSSSSASASAGASASSTVSAGSSDRHVSAAGFAAVIFVGFAATL